MLATDSWQYTSTSKTIKKKADIQSCNNTFNIFPIFTNDARGENRFYNSEFQNFWTHQRDWPPHFKVKNKKRSSDIISINSLLLLLQYHLNLWWSGLTLGILCWSLQACVDTFCIMLLSKIWTKLMQEKKPFGHCF